MSIAVSYMYENIKYMEQLISYVHHDNYWKLKITWVVTLHSVHGRDLFIIPALAIYGNVL